MLGNHYNRAFTSAAVRVCDGHRHALAATSPATTATHARWLLAWGGVCTRVAARAAPRGRWRPGLAAAAIFTFRVAWNEFLLANALADRNSRTVPVTIVNSMTEFDIDWGVIMATGMLLAIPPIIFTFVASRQIITGMTAGAVKG